MAGYNPRLKAKYKKEIIAAMQKEFQYKSPMQVPRLKKICLNQGLGIAVTDKKLVDVAVQEMSTIAGQKAVATK
jgi:large subunit ribosomal protein L5